MFTFANLELMQKCLFMGTLSIALHRWPYKQVGILVFTKDLQMGLYIYAAQNDVCKYQSVEHHYSKYKTVLLLSIWMCTLNAQEFFYSFACFSEDFL